VAQFIGSNYTDEMDRVLTSESDNSIGHQSSWVNVKRNGMVFVRETIKSLLWERSSISKYLLEEFRNAKG